MDGIVFSTSCCHCSIQTQLNAGGSYAEVTLQPDGCGLNLVLPTRFPHRGFTQSDTVQTVWSGEADFSDRPNRWIALLRDLHRQRGSGPGLPYRCRVWPLSAQRTPVSASCSLPGGDGIRDVAAVLPSRLKNLPNRPLPCSCRMRSSQSVMSVIRATAGAPSQAE